MTISVNKLTTKKQRRFHCERTTVTTLDLFGTILCSQRPISVSWGKDGKAVELSFQVVPAQVESQGPMGRSELAAIAGARGGALYETPAELVAAQVGLGYLIADGMEILRSDLVLVGMVAIGILGVAIDAVFRIVNDRYSWGG